MFIFYTTHNKTKKTQGGTKTWLRVRENFTWPATAEVTNRLLIPKYKLQRVREDEGKREDKKQFESFI